MVCTTVIDDVGSWNLDSNGDGCFDQGFPIQVTFLEEIQGTPTVSCGGDVDVFVTGGSPDFYPDSYTIINNGSGTLVNNIGLQSGGTFSIEGLTFGETYDVSISDPNGCSINVSGIYDYVDPVPSIDGLQAEFCLNDAQDAFEILIDGLPANAQLGEIHVQPTVTV